jgi:pseudaminic acid cytidylyltransferase
VNAVAIIPARGRSKRLPGKNIIDFLGKPIIAYTIDAALESLRFDRVIVSTEDHKISEVASACGALVDHRPASLADDTVGVVDVCIDYLDRESAAGRNWNVMTCLYATSPMRTAADVRATVALLEPGICEFAMAVTSYDLSVYHALKFASDKTLTPLFPDLIEGHEKDMPRLRVDNGSIYAVDVNAFRRHRTFYGPNLRGHDMPRERSSDIDTRDDYEHALWMAHRTSDAHNRIGR